jgi:hypothetical protein
MSVPTTPDCRIRFPAAAIDFASMVGITGQAHDGYPAPGDQPRFDWLRLFLIGLLANQASYNIPTEHREGSLWFNLNTLELEIQRNGSFVPLAQVVRLDTDANGQPITLAQWYAAAMPVVNSLGPVATFSGSCHTPNTTSIPIPVLLQAAANQNTHAMVYINGLLVDPRNCVYVGSPGRAASITLANGVLLGNGDRFTVVIMNMTPSLFHTPDVVI